MQGTGAFRPARRKKSALNRSQSSVHAQGDRGRNAKCAIHTFARLLTTEDDDARLVNEQSTDKVVAHAPEVGQFFDGIVAFKRRLVVDSR